MKRIQYVLTKHVDDGLGVDRTVPVAGYASVGTSLVPGYVVVHDERLFAGHDLFAKLPQVVGLWESDSIAVQHVVRYRVLGYVHSSRNYADLRWSICRRKRGRLK